MEDFSKYSNDDLLKMNQTLSKNFNKIKNEIILLHEILVNIEKDSKSILEELKRRT